MVVERDGAREEYTADVVVLSAGAINSAALLLASANDRHPDGLGNSSGQVGRNLMLHNNSSLIAISEVPNPTVFEKTLGINDFYYGDGDWDFPLGRDADARQERRLHDVARRARCRRPGRTRRPLARLLAHHRGPPTGREPGRRSATTVASGSTTRRPTSRRTSVSPASSAALLEAMRCRDDVVGRTQLPRRPARHLGRRPPERHRPGSATDPTTSVLDVNCRMHDVDNVYVVDAGFFVSSAAVNPTLTIIANALRVADHLRGVLA